MQLLELPLEVQEAVLTCLSLTDVREWACCCKASHSVIEDARRRAHEYLCMRDPSSPANWFALTLMDARRQACARTASSNIEQIAQNRDVAQLNSTGCGREISAKYVPGYWIDVDSPCQHSLFTCLETVALRCPQFVMITSCDQCLKYTLRDHHVALLSKAPYVAVPGNKGITDISLEKLSRCKAIWVSGCSGLRGENLPRLVAQHNALLQIKWLGGWGTEHPFDLPVWEWLRRQESMGLIVNQW